MLAPVMMLQVLLKLHSTAPPVGMHRLTLVTKKQQLPAHQASSFGLVFLPAICSWICNKAAVSVLVATASARSGTYGTADVVISILFKIQCHQTLRLCLENVLHKLLVLQLIRTAVVDVQRNCKKQSNMQLPSVLPACPTRPSHRTAGDAGCAHVVVAN